MYFKNPDNTCWGESPALANKGAAVLAPPPAVTSINNSGVNIPALSPMAQLQNNKIDFLLNPSSANTSASFEDSNNSSTALPSHNSNTPLAPFMYSAANTRQTVTPVLPSQPHHQNQQTPQQQQQQQRSLYLPFPQHSPLPQHIPSHLPLPQSSSPLQQLHHLGQPIPQFSGGLLQQSQQQPQPQHVPHNNNNNNSQQQSHTQQQQQQSQFLQQQLQQIQQLHQQQLQQQQQQHQYQLKPSSLHHAPSTKRPHSDISSSSPSRRAPSPASTLDNSLYLAHTSSSTPNNTSSINALSTAAAAAILSSQNHSHHPHPHPHPHHPANNGNGNSLNPPNVNTPNLNSTSILVPSSHLAVTKHNSNSHSNTSMSMSSSGSSVGSSSTGTTTPTATTRKKRTNKKKLKSELVIEKKFLSMKQSDAAFHLGFSPSTFSKRWRNSLPDRKWPFRKHFKLQNSIKDLKALQKRGFDVTKDLETLLAEKAENLMPAIIHYCEKDILARQRSSTDDGDEDESSDE